MKFCFPNDVDLCYWIFLLVLLNAFDKIFVDRLTICQFLKKIGHRAFEKANSKINDISTISLPEIIPSVFLSADLKGRCPLGSEGAIIPIVAILYFLWFVPQL